MSGEIDGVLAAARGGGANEHYFGSEIDQLPGFRAQRMNLMNTLREALAAYDARPKEDAALVAEVARRIREHNRLERSGDAKEFLEDVLRPYIAPAQAGEVSVRVETLRNIRARVNRERKHAENLMNDNERQFHARALEYLRDDLDKLLPPTAPEPSAELRREWEREASIHAGSEYGDDKSDVKQVAYDSFLAALESAWRKRDGKERA